MLHVQQITWLRIHVEWLSQSLRCSNIKFNIQTTYSCFLEPKTHPMVRVLDYNPALTSNFHNITSEQV